MVFVCLFSQLGRSASSSGRNFWVSGLASTTRATDLKNLFSKYGKVRGFFKWFLVLFLFVCTSLFETVLIRLFELSSLKVPMKGIQLSKILWDIKEKSLKDTLYDWGLFYSIVQNI